ncbi:mannitol dehydrogenase family protein [Ruania zhangjianzhongii]|uniref:mannitol dehydrogenase family protein n=1 Tax=Ruania zhangjianzhongii TaxID=2603206 RepID=UPI0011C7EC3D|nr:mannitol dehydrogenase family protein [Ruania zhangjianzhongii]
MTTTGEHTLPTLGRDVALERGMAGTAAPSPGILHLGYGNFHRAHQAVYTNAAVQSHGGDWGIVGVANSSREVVYAVESQDHLYTVVTIAPERTEFQVPRVLAETLVAAQQADRVVAQIAAAEIKIVTLTVTEHGYTFEPSTGGIDLANPLVQHDLQVVDQPRTSIGQIVRGLQARMRASGAPISILSCDNLGGNGDRTRDIVTDFIDHLPGDQARDLLTWVESQVTFPNSMVDRIVPATNDAHRDRVATMCGYRDAVPVPAEPFTMWVIEDRFAAGRPRWEAGGAIFSTEVDRYEQMKLRLLNGTHSLIAYLGALSGAETIPASVGQAAVADAAHRVLTGEYLPSVDLPGGVIAADYERALFGRWSNTALGHRTSQVGSDGSVKLPQRVCTPALQALGEGVMPQHLALSVAGYLACIAPLDGFDPGPHAHAMSDPARPALGALAARSTDGRTMARAVFESEEIFPSELAAQGDFVARVGEYVDIISTAGVASAIDEAALTHQPTTRA